MRLRYLHLPHCGPLQDVAVCFGRDQRSMQLLDMPRAQSGGSLNFIVGVNGSGKSTILRVLYHAFRALRNRQWPDLPLTLVWDTGAEWTKQEQSSDSYQPGPCRMLHRDALGQSHSFLIAALRSACPEDLSADGWRELTRRWQAWESPMRGGEHIPGELVLGHGLLNGALPKQVLAYTSGSEALWQQLDLHHLVNDSSETAIDSEAERPPVWTLQQEWQQEVPRRLLRSLGDAATGKLDEGDLSRLKILRQQLARQPAALAAPSFDQRIGPAQMRTAAMLTALYQAAHDYCAYPDATAQEALRHSAITEPDAADARMVLNRIDWLLPTHCCLTYYDPGDALPEADRQQLWALLALADEVIAQPRGRMQAIISLGPRSNLSIAEALETHFEAAPRALAEIADRIQNEPSGASALLRIFSKSDDLHACLFDACTTLNRWHDLGLLEHLGLTITRLHQIEAMDGSRENQIVSYDQLSDGEQVLLGRMALPFLLRGQDGSLLLLDEPETHFNDVWKRELVTMLDRALLDSTQAQVVLATHTSIALSDALAAEVTVLDKDHQTGRTTAEGIPHALFGVDPSRLLLKVFEAPDITGSRSAQLLRKLLDPGRWQPEDRDDLEHLIDLIGSGWPRARLMDILEGLEGGRAPSDS